MSNKIDMIVFEELLALGSGNISINRLIFTLSTDQFGEEIVSYEGGYEAYKREVEKLKEKFEYKHLDQNGGGEGGAEYCYGVFTLKGKTYKAEWSYYSHDGYHYEYITETLKEVKPVQKTITVYE